MRFDMREGIELQRGVAGIDDGADLLHARLRQCRSLRLFGMV